MTFTRNAPMKKPTPRTVKADWIEGLSMYSVCRYGWRSQDGDTWIRDDGLPVDSPKFGETTICLCGGPRHGERVG